MSKIVCENIIKAEDKIKGFFLFEETDSYYWMKHLAECLEKCEISIKRLLVRNVSDGDEGPDEHDFGNIQDYLAAYNNRFTEHSVDCTNITCKYHDTEMIICVDAHVKKMEVSIYNCNEEMEQLLDKLYKFMSEDLDGGTFKRKGGEFHWRVTQEGHLYVLGKGVLEQDFIRTEYEVNHGDGWDGHYSSYDVYTEWPWDSLKGKITYITIGPGITGLGKEAFRDYHALKKLELLEGLVMIGSKALYNTSLEQVILPETLRVIKEDAFGNTKLRNIRIPDNVEYIHSSSFSGTQLCVGARMFQHDARERNKSSVLEDTRNITDESKSKKNNISKSKNFEGKPNETTELGYEEGDKSAKRFLWAIGIMIVLIAYIFMSQR